MRAQNGFQRANVHAIAAAARKYEEVRFEPGDELWKAGDPSSGVLVLARGTIACETATGARFKYGPGTGVGGVDTLADKPRWYTAVAETKVQAFRGETAGFLDLLEHDYSLASEFLSFLARGLIGLVERKARLGQKPLAQIRDVSRLGAAPVGA
jgi:CRP-like cAMP-binding protein